MGLIIIYIMLAFFSLMCSPAMYDRFFNYKPEPGYGIACVILNIVFAVTLIALIYRIVVSSIDVYRILPDLIKKN